MAQDLPGNFSGLLLGFIVGVSIFISCNMGSCFRIIVNGSLDVRSILLAGALFRDAHTRHAPFRVGSKERQSNDHARRGRRIGAVLALSEASIQATFSIFLQYVLHGVFAPKDFALVDHFAAKCLVVW